MAERFEVEKKRGRVLFGMICKKLRGAVQHPVAPPMATWEKAIQFRPKKSCALVTSPEKKDATSLLELDGPTQPAPRLEGRTFRYVRWQGPEDRG